MEKPFDITTHNGCITIVSGRTGAHRTIRVKYAKSMGKRIIEMLVGNDNENSYKGFGTVEADGKITLWRGRDSDFFRILAKMVMNPEEWLDRATFQFEGKCIRCNRKLTNPESLKSGIGPECAKR